MKARVRLPTKKVLAERVAGGDISMSPAEIRTMAQLAEKAGRLQIRSANNVAARLKRSPAFGTVGQQIMIDEPPQYKASNLLILPQQLSRADRDASVKNARNAILRNPSQKAAIIQRLEQTASQITDYDNGRTYI